MNELKCKTEEGCTKLRLIWCKTVYLFFYDNACNQDVTTYNLNFSYWTLRESMILCIKNTFNPLPKFVPSRSITGYVLGKTVVVELHAIGKI